MDLQRIRLHDLRHVPAILPLKERLRAKAVRERLGRSMVAFTVRVDKHVLQGMHADTAATLGELVLGD